ncbi:MAG TPA: nuclear transport factor 2 family protein [Thermoanaerobaculia bacterium]|nr:nuclear transport factor 2 family protein [Thermoanaerobaculia bacterium]
MIAIVLAALMLRCSALPPVVESSANAEREVRKLERAWLDAYEQYDTAAMNAIVADDFVITFPDGSTQTKAQVVASIKTPPPPGNSTRFHTTETRARVYGDTVVLTGNVIGTYSQNGKSSSEHYRYTDTYVKQGGRWQVVASHLSKAPVVASKSSGVSSNAGQGRSVTGNKLLSLKPPSLAIEVDEELPHVGILNFTLKDAAQVERYFYARADEAGRVQRLLIIQFESILPGVKGSYSFPITNPTRLGDYDYDTTTGIFNFAKAIAANPGAEAEHTKALLEKNGFKVDHDFRVARYARIVGDEKRGELIFFYLEADAEEGFTELQARAKKSFQVTDYKPSGTTGS